MEVRLPVFKIGIENSVIGAGDVLMRVGRARIAPRIQVSFCLFAAATSSSVRNSLLAFAAERSRGTSYITNQVPCRSGSPQAVRGEAPLSPRFLCGFGGGFGFERSSKHGGCASARAPASANQTTLTALENQGITGENIVAGDHRQTLTESR